MFRNLKVFYVKGRKIRVRDLLSSNMYCTYITSHDLLLRTPSLYTFLLKMITLEINDNAH